MSASKRFVVVRQIRDQWGAVCCTLMHVAGKQASTIKVVSPPTLSLSLAGTAREAVPARSDSRSSLENFSFSCYNRCDVSIMLSLSDKYLEVKVEKFMFKNLPVPYIFSISPKQFTSYTTNYSESPLKSVTAAAASESDRGPVPAQYALGRFLNEISAASDAASVFGRRGRVVVCARYAAAGSDDESGRAGRASAARAAPARAGPPAVCFPHCYQNAFYFAFSISLDLTTLVGVSSTWLLRPDPPKKFRRIFFLIEYVLHT
ncbi:hypothetical protein EVAR_46316_1 [Eumeta japonica]|uniref:Uncharacterized protein n=1 Tax=Eumeta variegata TaxID=151549 RepID=A0A4C1XYC4_EUMVA|nr:hypothetical protein EVAR_46316_1 [Eumeta japonica]